MANAGGLMISTGGATHTKLDLVIFQHPDKSFEYAINDIPFLKDHDLQAKVGETRIWTLNNKTEKLDENEQPVHPIAWKDTIDVPFEKTTKIIVKFDDRPGMWMTHCHILDHADGGLMGMVHLESAK